MRGQAHRGRVFEKEIEFTNSIYEDLGKAHIWRINVEKIYSRRQGRVVHVRKVPADFMGYLENGQAVLIETKSTEKQFWEVKFFGKYATTKPHQLEALRVAHDSNVLSGLLLRLGFEMTRVYAFSPPFLWRLLELDSTVPALSQEFKWLLEKEMRDKAEVVVREAHIPERTGQPLDAFFVREMRGGWDYIHSLEKQRRLLS